MATKHSVLSLDGQWKVEIEAYKNNWFFYKAIGATTRAYHMEETRFLGFLWSTGRNWVERNVAIISTGARFNGLLPVLTGIDSESCVHQNASSCDVRKWAFGIGVTIQASPRSGGPDSSTGGTPNTGGASLEIREVVATGSASINNQSFVVGPVIAS